MKYKHNLFILIIIISLFISSISKADVLFEPLVANPFEARVGTIYDGKNDKMRLDIGTSLDLLEISNSEKHKINLGTDFMTYTRLRSEGKLKFPVETSDYFFGINFSGIYQLEDSNSLEYRIRVAHISSHLIDGYTNLPEYTFRQMPFVFSKEFVDALVALRIGDSRVYVGLNSIFSTKPKNITNFVPQAGFEHKAELLNNLHLVGGYDVKLVGTNSVLQAQNAIQLGVKYQEKDKAGVFVGLYYFSGPSIHGMFYDKKDNYLGIGFQVIP